MALVNEVKEMKEIFEQMEDEVEQNAVDKQCADIEKKNLLIENENLIADYCSAEVNAASENMLEVNAASENMLEVTTTSEYQVNVAS
ncbi:hypothetical protein Tco_0514749 [Tanacetum coccineum]